MVAISEREREVLEQKGKSTRKKERKESRLDGISCFRPASKGQEVGWREEGENFLKLSHPLSSIGGSGRGAAEEGREEGSVERTSVRRWRRWLNLGFSFFPPPPPQHFGNVLPLLLH